MGTTIQAQSIAVSSSDKDTLFIKEDMYHLIVDAWDSNYVDEPRPYLECVEELSRIEKRIQDNELARVRAEKWDRFRKKHRYVLFFMIPIPISQ